MFIFRIRYNYMLKIVLVGLLIACLESKPLKASKVVKALNCGSKDGSIKSDSDFKYEHDTNYVSGQSVDVDYHSTEAAAAAEMKYTLEKEIYMYERHTYEEMTYSLPVRKGAHTLILKFAEMYFEKSGQRVFDIRIGNKVVIADMDVFARTGSRYAAHEEYLEFEIKVDGVYVKGEKIPGGMKESKMQLKFTKGKADNPIVQAIVVYNAPLEETSYEEYKTIKNNWSSHQELIKARKENEQIKELLATQKKKERVLIRNDQLLADKATAEEVPSEKPEKFGMIRSFLMSPIGILIWSAVFVFKLYFYYTKVFKMNQVSPDLKQE